MSATVKVMDPVSLYNGVASGSEDRYRDEVCSVGAPPFEDRILRNIVTPTLTPVLPRMSNATGTGVLVCPGGGYFALSIDHEGLDVAEWLAGRGVAAFVLKYRLMESPESEQAMAKVMESAAEAAEDAGAGDPEAHPVLAELMRRMDEFADSPLADGRVAIDVIRRRSDEWGVVRSRLGALGFSAGGRLLLDLSLQAKPELRPAFVGLIYAVYPGRPLPDDAPAAFVAAAADDPLFNHSLRAHDAWRQARRSVEAHLYTRGGHGFGLHRQGLPSDDWIEQFHRWMTSEGF